MASLKYIFLTTGDVDGIGLEVSIKALLKIGPITNVRFLLLADSDQFKRWEKKISTSRFRLKICSELSDVENPSHSKNTLCIFLRKDPPIQWVEDVSRYCLKRGRTHGLVTGPLSKTGIHQAGFKDLGHTDLLKRVSKRSSLFQTYLGSKMNVLLITDHLSLESVPKKVKDLKLMNEALKLCLPLKKQLKLSGSIGLLALDPHAGEEGIIGKQDQIHAQWIQKKSNKDLIGPIPADTAFEKSQRKKIGLYLALYHDQGLIPFKTLHGFDEGVHLTLGLPFVRTSVDHGTAKEIFGKNLANPGSMKDAIKTAIRLIGSKK